MGRMKTVYLLLTTIWYRKWEDPCMVVVVLGPCVEFGGDEKWMPRDRWGRRWGANMACGEASISQQQGAVHEFGPSIAP